MNQTVLQQTPTPIATASLAGLSKPHGYRFDGDEVHLQARFTVLDPGANQRTWALQLWACPSAPVSARDLAGQMVAEVALPPMSEVADETEHVDMSGFACPPAGGSEHFMALVLAAGRPGQFDEVHDVAVYPRPQRFLQPRMRGTVGYRIEGDRVHLSVEHIENPRDAANRSGTLALELWALAAPYAGGAFQGTHLAGVVIGTSFGQTESASTSFELPFSSPPAGEWHFVLMLREWTAAGYVTRDFTNFINPVMYGLAPAAMPPKTVPLVPAKAAPLKPTVPEKAESARLLQDVAVTSASKMASAPAKTLTWKEEHRAPIAPVAVKVAAGVSHSVSVNTASEVDLTAVEGLSAKLARAIIRKRPFTSLNDLRRVKGISASLLTKIHSRLRL